MHCWTHDCELISRFKSHYRDCAVVYVRRFHTGYGIFHCDSIKYDLMHHWYRICHIPYKNVSRIATYGTAQSLYCAFKNKFWTLTFHWMGSNKGEGLKQNSMSIWGTLHSLVTHWPDHWKTETSTRQNINFASIKQNLEKKNNLTCQLFTSSYVRQAVSKLRHFCRIATGAGGGGEIKRAECPPSTAKNTAKNWEKIREKRGKNQGNEEKSVRKGKKSQKFFYFAFPDR